MEKLTKAEKSKKVFEMCDALNHDFSLFHDLAFRIDFFVSNFKYMKKDIGMLTLESKNYYDSLKRMLDEMGVISERIKSSKSILKELRKLKINFKRH